MIILVVLKNGDLIGTTEISQYIEGEPHTSNFMVGMLDTVENNGGMITYDFDGEPLELVIYLK